MYLNLDEIKTQLNLDKWYTDEDAYLISLGKVAEDILQKNIDDKLDNIASQSDGCLPQSLRHAMLLLIGHFYRNRESVAFGSPTELPLGYSFLINQYKNYKESKI